MEQTLTAAPGELNIIPSPDSTRNDFDFFLGKWSIRNRKLKTRLNGCFEWSEFDAKAEARKILGGAGNIDSFYASPGGRPFEGMTLRLFDPTTRLWSIYWADSNEAVLDKPVKGSFENGIGRFYARDTINGKEIVIVFNWDATNPESPVWSQAFSADNGQTWEWNWYMYFSRE